MAGPRNNLKRSAPDQVVSAVNGEVVEAVDAFDYCIRPTDLVYIMQENSVEGNGPFLDVYGEAVEGAIENYSPQVIYTLLRYSAVLLLRHLSLMQKVETIAAMMKADDEKEDEFDLDHYAEIFYTYPRQLGWSLDLIQLFFMAGVVGKCPDLASGLLVKCIAHHNPGSDLYLHAEFFVNAGANVNYQASLENNPDKFTPLHYAIFRENIDIAIMIVNSPQASIDYTLQDAKGRTVLVLAAMMKKTTLLQNMLNDARSITALNIPDHENRTALHYGYLLGCSIMVESLLKTNVIDITARDVNGKLPHQLLHASPDEVTRVLNSVSLDERRYMQAQRNYFQLTPLAPMMTPPVDLGIIPAKFRQDGTEVPEAELADKDEPLNILNCPANAAYVIKFWYRIQTVGGDMIPEKINRMWQLQQANIASTPPTTLLQDCINGQRYMLDKQLRSSFLVPNTRLFNPVVQQQESKESIELKEAVSAIVITADSDSRTKMRRIN